MRPPLSSPPPIHMPKPIDTTPYYKKHLSPLVGCRVIAILVDSEDPADRPYIGYHLHDDKTGKTYELVALSDPEGNGPGHLSITLLTASNTLDTTT